jgi:hypothetical protein
LEEQLSDSGMKTQGSALLRQGLRCYAKGQYDLARRSWEGALNDDDCHVRAVEYLKYIEEHGLSGNQGTPMVVTPAGDNQQGAQAHPENPWDFSNRAQIVHDLDAQPSMKTPIDDALSRANTIETWSFNAQNSAFDEAAPQSDGQVDEHDRPADLTRTRAKMRESFELGDFSGALQAAEAVLAADASCQESLFYFKQATDRQLAMYESKLGGLHLKPRLVSRPEEVIWMNLHPRSGYLLSFVDGTLSFQQIIDISAMPAVEVLGVMVKLLHAKSIQVGS